MSHFRLLRDPASYVAHDWDLLADSSARKHWLDHFVQHFEVMLSHAATQYGRTAGRSVPAARQQFTAAIDALRKKPSSLPSGKLDIYELCRLRDATLRSCGLADPFKAVKDRENASAAALYPAVVRRLHAMTGKERWLHLVRCVFAGNVFDLGSQATMHLAAERTDFLAAVANGKSRPWLIDDFDRLAEDLKTVPPAPWGKVLIFVDNAGTDFVLGVMPLARELALSGARIVLAANELPSLNDITADETVAVLAQLGATDDDLAVLLEAGMFEVVSTGNGSPLIDLSEVSDELNEAAADVELVVLVGMGRAVESNLDARFTVSALHLALLKDAAVAKRIGGALFDCVCKYTPAGQ